MAAAFANFVTCDICFEVYEDPQELSCRHTFCIKCVNKIKGQTTIQCPICKATSNLTDVKSDFKTAALLETYLGEQKQQQSEVKCNTTGSDDIAGSKDDVKLCDVCSKEGEVHNVVCKCKDCDYLLCKLCEGLHRSDVVTKEHVVLSVVKVASEAKLGIQKLLEDLCKWKHELSSERNQLREMIGNLDSTEKEALEKITMEEEELIAQIKAHHNELRDEVNDTVLKAKGTMKENEMNIRKKFKEVKAKVVMIEDFLKQKTDLVLAEIGDTFCQEIKSGLATTETEYKVLESELKELTFDVVKGTGYQKDQGTSVTFDGGIGENVQDCQMEGFSLFTDIDYILHKHVEVLQVNSKTSKEYVPKLSFMGDEIQYLLSNNAYYYDKDLNLTRKINFSKTSHIVAAVQTKSGHYVTACARKGLNIHDDTGKHLQQISPSIYSAIYLRNKEIYAYNGINNKLCTFQQTAHFWIKVKEVEFDHKGLNDKVHMTHDEIYISSKVQKCVCKYNYSGKLLKIYGMSEEGTVDQSEVKGQLEDPVVCSIDKYVNVLVVHGLYDLRKCIVFTENGQLSELDISINSLRYNVYVGTMKAVIIDIESKCVVLAVSYSGRSSLHIVKCKPNILPDIL